MSEIQQTDLHKNTSNNNKSTFSKKNTTNNTCKTHTYLGTCSKCNEFGHITKECKNNLSDTNLNDQQEQTMINTCRNTHNTSPVLPIKYPTTISATKPPILTKQISADFQILQEAWKQVSSQMNKMIETNKFLKRQSRPTYKHLTNKQKQNLRNYPQPKTTATETEKTVKFIDNKIKHDNNDGKTHRKKLNVKKH